FPRIAAGLGGGGGDGVERFLVAVLETHVATRERRKHEDTKNTKQHEAGLTGRVTGSRELVNGRGRHWAVVTSGVNWQVRGGIGESVGCSGIQARDWARFGRRKVDRGRRPGRWRRADSGEYCARRSSPR